MERNIPQWAERYVGIPYKTHGRDREGCDCWGLFNMIWREQLGKELPPYDGVDWYHGQKPENVSAGALAYSENFVEILRGNEKLGDGLLLRLRGHPFHCGIVLSPGWMLHTHDGAGSCIEAYETIWWSKRVTGIYRYIF